MDPLELMREVKLRSPHSKLILLQSTSVLPDRAADENLAWLHLIPQPGNPWALIPLLRDSVQDPLYAQLMSPVLPRVLCLDDDPEFLRSLCRLLGSHGYQVLPCEDPEDALDQIASNIPQLAILDVAMWGKNGLDVAEEIGTHFTGEIPIILLSALGEEDDDRLDPRGEKDVAGTDRRVHARIVSVEDAHDPLGLPHAGRRLEEQRIHYAEHRGVGADGSALFHQSFPQFIHPDDGASRIEDIGKDHGRPAENIIFQGYTLIDRNVVLNLDVIAHSNIGADYHILPDFAVLSNL